MTVRIDMLEDWEPRVARARYRVSVLASDLQISERQLERFARARFGCTLREWIGEIRMKRALELITAGASVKELAAALSYGHPSDLTRAFRRRFGCTPRDIMHAIRSPSPRDMSENALPWRELHDLPAGAAPYCMQLSSAATRNVEESPARPAAVNP